jgi:hypothetical protein
MPEARSVSPLLRCFVALITASLQLGLGLTPHTERLAPPGPSVAAVIQSGGSAHFPCAACLAQAAGMEPAGTFVAPPARFVDLVVTCRAALEVAHSVPYFLPPSRAPPVPV